MAALGRLRFVTLAALVLGVGLAQAADESPAIDPNPPAGAKLENGKPIGGQSASTAAARPF